MKSGICIGLLTLLAVSISGAQQQPKVTGFFTDMHYVPDAGDVVGMEVWIVSARDRFYAAVQDAEGEPDPPVVAPVEVSGLRVRFTVKKPAINTATITIPAVTTHYSGTVSRSGLTISVEGKPGELLKRQNSFWQ
jgi:hypothetical protein